MKRALALACVLLLTLTSACGAMRSRNDRAERAERAPQAVRAGELRLEELAPQPLVRGACGMFLWARTGEQSVFVFVAFANPAEAHVRLDGRARVLRRSAAEGPSQHGHFEEQTYADSGLTIETDVQFSAEPLRNGAVISGGVMRVRDREGWETIVPVTGMVACQT
jgi:hypothetical protein